MSEEVMSESPLPDELTELDSYIEELQRKDAERLKERELNSMVPSPDRLAKLDSSIKKSAAFVRKIKNLGEPTKDQLLREIGQLNLSKYLSEITAALVELKIKTSEVPLYVQVCSELHRTYAEFSDLLLESWAKTLPKTIEEILNYSKLRVDLRLFAELCLCGIFKLKEALSLLGNLLKLLLSEKESIHLNVIVNFAKHCGWDFAGLISSRFKILAEQNGREIPKSSFLSAERQKGLRALMHDYYKRLELQLKKQSAELLVQKQQNKQLLITKGEISENRKKSYEDARNHFNKMLTTVQQFAEILDEEKPKLDENVAELEEIPVECFNQSKMNVADMPLWPDDSVKSFYEDLPNLKSLVPAHLYKESIKEKYGKTKKEKSVTREKRDLERNELKEDKSELTDQMLAEKLSKELVNEESDEEPLSIEKEMENLRMADSDDEFGRKNKSKTLMKEESEKKVVVEELFAQLLTCLNKATIDKVALDFAMVLNNKKNRRKLIGTLFTCPRTRLDLLPFFARLTAILNPIMPLVGADLVYLLKKDFRFHIMKKDQMKIESKVKNVRFIGELTKFGIFPKEETLQCLKILLLDFAHHHIEMACNLLEVCGRYLYLSTPTHHKCTLLLEQMMRKKNLIAMQPKYISMIENAFYSSCPSQTITSGNLTGEPIRKKSDESKYTKPHLYMRHLIYQELNKMRIEKVLRKLRDLPYGNKEVQEYVISCFIEVWNVKFYNLKAVANCLAALDQYYSFIAYYVADAVLEDIRLMLELNQPKYNQRRIVMVKYLGELYNYKLVDSTVIIKTLYLLISFGVNPNYEKFNEVWMAKMTSGKDDEEFDRQLIEYGESELDEGDSLFRARLVSVLLDTVGPYFTSSTSKKKLLCFLTFFQLYFERKRALPVFASTPFPMDMQFLFVDSIRKIKPKFKFAVNYSNAFFQLQEMLAELAPTVSKLLPKMDKDAQTKLSAIVEQDDDEDSEDEDEDEDDEEEDDDEEDEEDDTSVQPENEQIHDLDESRYSDDEEEDADAEFQRELDRMVSESLAARSNENVRSMNSDIIIPVNKLSVLTKPQTQSFGLLNQNSQIEEPERKFNLILMTKSKNKPVLKKLEVPIDSEIAVNMREKEKAQQMEKEMVKKLTLDINERREMEDQMSEQYSDGNLLMNFNRDNRRKYNHLKGVPDADLIFGPNKRR